MANGIVFITFVLYVLGVLLNLRFVVQIYLYGGLGFTVGGLAPDPPGRVQ